MTDSRCCLRFQSIDLLLPTVEPLVVTVKDLVTPRQVAQAIAVSESSLKRWCDKGLIPTVYTAGGHRRIPVNGVLAYLRTAGLEIMNPEILGLPKATTGGGERKLLDEKSRLIEALLKGDEQVCVGVVLNLHLANYPMSLICDEVLAKSFLEIGERWDCGDVAVYQERRSCELCHRVMHEVRRVFQEFPVDAPIAVGGTLDGDPYTLASSMVELVLRDLGWRAASLGNMLPFASLAHALCETRPKLFWLSVSVIRDQSQFLKEFDTLSQMAFANGVSLVVGGKALSDEIRKEMRYSAYCDNFQHLAAFATELLKR